MRRLRSIQNYFSTAVLLRHFFGCGPNTRVLKNALSGALFFLVFLSNFGGVALMGQNPADEVPIYEHIGEEGLPSVGLSNLNPDDLTIAVATDPQDYIYTLSFGSGVDKRNADGTIQEEDFISPGQLDSPLDIAIDEEGFIYIVDYSDDEEDYNEHGKIRIFDSEGNVDRVISTGFYRPMGIDVDSENIYIAEYYDGSQGPEQGTEFSRISIFNKQTGMRIDSNDNDVEIPFRIAVNSQGTVYVSQAGDNDPTVLIFDSSLNYKDKLTNIQSPGSIVVDEFDYIHVIEYGGKINFGQLLDFANIGFSAAIEFTHQVFHGIEDNDYGIKIFNSNDSFEYFFQQEIDFPIDIVFNDCDKMFLLNVNVIELYHVDTWLVHEFLPSELESDLEIYERTPSFDSVEGPEIFCVGDITVTAEPGNDFATVEFDDATATDNCSATVEQTEGLPSGSEFPVGTHTIEFTATDEFGTQATCTFTISVNPSEDEDIPPEAICNDFSVYLDANGEVEIIAEDVYGGTENLELNIDVSSFDCTNVGSNTVELTVTDRDTGLSDSCFATITVIDDVAPEALCISNFNIRLVRGESRTLDAIELDSGSYDACSEFELTYSLSKYTFTDADEGPNPIEFKVTDEYGNEAVCPVNIQVIVEDAEPSFDCGTDDNLSLSLDEDCNYPSEDFSYLIENRENFVNGIFMDQQETRNGNILEVNIKVYHGDSADDPYVGECDFQIKLTDEMAPVANCVAPFTVTLDSSGNASITVADIDNSSTDNCGIDSRTLSQYDFTTADIGVVPVTLTVTDASGLTDECTVDVTVEEAVGPDPPEAVCNDFSVYLDVNGVAQITAEDIYDGTENLQLSIDISFFDCSKLGSNPVELTVTDPATGLSDSCQAIITVIDNSAPVANCVSPFTVTLDSSGNASITVADIDNSSPDNCGIDSRTLSQYDFTTADIGVVPVTLTVTDSSGLTDECTVDVTVEEAVGPDPPEAVCNDFSVYLDANGEAQITAEDVYGGNENFELDIDISSFDCTNVGSNTVKLTVTDPDTGLSDSCPATITVIDNSAPVANCVSPFTVSLDANGNASITEDDIDNNSTDNCEIVTRTLSQYDFTTADIGVVPVTLTVTDASGLTDECTVDITVEEADGNTPSDFECVESITVELDDNGFATLDKEDFYTGDGSDYTFTLGKTSFSCADVGSQTVNFQYSGPTSGTCSVAVTVKDDTPPVAVCVEEFTIYLNEQGEGRITADIIDRGSTDNCGILQTLSKNTFGIDDVGEQEITLTVTDASGNVDTCTTTITVEPYDEETGITCAEDITLPLSETGEFNLDLTYSGDEENVDYEVSKGFFTCNDLGTQRITVTYWGEHSGSCEIDVTIVDDTSPVANCVSEYDLRLDANGTASLSAEDLNLDSSDNCGITDMTLSKNNFTTADLGTQEVIFTAIDGSENSSTCTVTVNVLPYEEEEQPVECVDMFAVQIGANGSAVLDPEDIFTGGSDVNQISLSRDTFTCNDLGENTVTLNYTTSSGDGSCEILIIVEDPNSRCEDTTEPEREYITLYPNPSDGLVRFETSPGLIILRMEVFDMRGRFLFEKTYEDNLNAQFDYGLDLREYQSGVYSILIHTNGREYLRRAIIER